MSRQCIIRPRPQSPLSDLIDTTYPTGKPETWSRDDWIFRRSEPGFCSHPSQVPRLLGAKNFQAWRVALLELGLKEGFQDIVLGKCPRPCHSNMHHNSPRGLKIALQEEKEMEKWDQSNKRALECMRHTWRRESAPEVFKWLVREYDHDAEAWLQFRIDAPARVKFTSMTDASEFVKKIKNIHKELEHLTRKGSPDRRKMLTECYQAVLKAFMTRFPMEAMKLEPRIPVRRSNYGRDSPINWNVTMGFFEFCSRFVRADQRLSPYPPSCPVMVDKRDLRTGNNIVTSDPLAQVLVSDRRRHGESHMAQRLPVSDSSLVPDWKHQKSHVVQSSPKAVPMLVGKSERSLVAHSSPTETSLQPSDGKSDRSHVPPALPKKTRLGAPDRRSDGLLAIQATTQKVLLSISDPRSDKSPAAQPLLEDSSSLAEGRKPEEPLPAQPSSKKPRVEPSVRRSDELVVAQPLFLDGLRSAMFDERSIGSSVASSSPKSYVVHILRAVPLHSGPWPADQPAIEI